MIAIENVLVGDEIVQKQFVCDLAKCKGGCCEEGDAGAPLEASELDVLVELYDKIEPYLTEESIAEIKRKGKYVYHKEFGWVTPTLGNDHEICVYGKRDEKGIIKCGFESAYYDGVISWKKPISCHLFPILSQKGKAGNYDRINYEPRESLCKPACGLGKKLKVPVYVFLKEPLIRLHGEEFYKALDATAKELNSNERELI
ncbi:MAG: DUF3109 family protein [Chitinophagaceae bacterium]